MLAQALQDFIKSHFHIWVSLKSRFPEQGAISDSSAIMKENISVI